MHITVIGAGAWGTALAIAASRPHAQHPVRLHVRDPAQAQALHQQRCNTRYLPEVALPESLVITTGPLEGLTDSYS